MGYMEQKYAEHQRPPRDAPAADTPAPAARPRPPPPAGPPPMAFEAQLRVDVPTSPDNGSPPSDLSTPGPPGLDTRYTPEDLLPKLAPFPDAEAESASSGGGGPAGGPRPSAEPGQAKSGGRKSGRK